PKPLPSMLPILFRFNRAKPKKNLTNSHRLLPACRMKNGTCAKSATSSGQTALLRSIDPPDEVAVEQDQKLQDDFDRWQKDLDAFSRAHPEAAERRPVRSLLLPVGDFEADPAPRFKEASDWTSPTVEYQSGPCLRSNPALSSEC